MVKRSKQRDAILNFLTTRVYHPTAETIYSSLKGDYPKLSLGTVYRNLGLLADMGSIQKITTINGPERYDGNPKTHPHFFCNHCGAVLDLDVNLSLHDEELTKRAQDIFDGRIEYTMTNYYGICSNCLNKNDIKYGQ